MDQKNFARPFKTFFCTILLVFCCTVTIWAGTWEPQDGGGHRYKQDDGTYLTNTWLQENGKWYFFDEQGLLVVNGIVEGYQLGADGAELSGAAAINTQYAQLVLPASAQQTAGEQHASGTAASETKVQKSVETETEAAKTVTYVLNKNTKKFHKPGCSSVSDMAAKNRLDSGASRDEIIGQGYVPCKRCKP